MYFFRLLLRILVTTNNAQQSTTQPDRWARLSCQTAQQTRSTRGLLSKSAPERATRLPQTPAINASGTTPHACTPTRKHANRNTGKPYPMGVKKGDRVLLPEFTPTMFKVGDDKYGIYSEQDILCRLD